MFFQNFFQLRKILRSFIRNDKIEHNFIDGEYLCTIITIIGYVMVFNKQLRSCKE